jgi:dTDP-4-dehydrorhamnose reductase
MPHAAATLPRPCCAWRQERERLTVIDDQWGAPTGADLLADVTAHAIRTCSTDRRTAACTTAWRRARPLGILCEIRAGARQQSAASYKNNSKRSRACAHQCLPHARQAPAQLAAGYRQAANHLRLQLPHWQTGVARMLAEIL